MPHERKRHLEPILRHLAKISGLVGLLGHRQVGKTTLLEAISKHYLSFDDEELLNYANKNAKKFISEHKDLATGIDECQLSEKIFPALKERVRKDKRPGQFYLSGSVRFTSKKLIRESLTGRIMSAELLPLTLSEFDSSALPDHLLRILKARSVKHIQFEKLSSREFARRQRLIDRVDKCGGLPGVCFLKKDSLRTQKTIDQLETILSRDLQQIHETTLTLPEVMRFVRQLSLHDGGPIQYQELKRLTNISSATQKKLLFALEATFVIRHVPIEGDIHESAIFFEDHGEVCVLAQNQLTEEQRWSGLVYRNLREQIFYRIGENAQVFQYRTRSGVLVPFAIRTQDSVLAVIPVKGPIERSNIAAAHSFFRKYSNSKAILVTDQKETHALDERILVVSAANMLFA